MGDCQSWKCNIGRRNYCYVCSTTSRIGKAKRLPASPTSTTGPICTVALARLITSSQCFISCFPGSELRSNQRHPSARNYSFRYACLPFTSSQREDEEWMYWRRWDMAHTIARFDLLDAVTLSASHINHTSVNLMYSKSETSIVTSTVCRMLPNG